jgi:hypothetical protein
MKPSDQLKEILQRHFSRTVSSLNKREDLNSTRQLKIGWETPGDLLGEQLVSVKYSQHSKVDFLENRLCKDAHICKQLCLRDWMVHAQYLKECHMLF